MQAFEEYKEKQRMHDAVKEVIQLKQQRDKCVAAAKNADTVQYDSKTDTFVVGNQRISAEPNKKRK